MLSQHEGNCGELEGTYIMITSGGLAIGLQIGDVHLQPSLLVQIFILLLQNGISI